MITKCQHGLQSPCPYCEPDKLGAEKLDIIYRAIRDKRLLRFDYMPNKYQVNLCLKVIPHEVTDQEYLVGENVNHNERERFKIADMRHVEIVTFDIPA